MFNEIKGRIKLADKSVPLKIKDILTGLKLRKKEIILFTLGKKLNSEKQEVIWNGDKEKSKYKSPYFGLGDLSVSFDDKILGLFFRFKRVRILLYIFKRFGNK